MITYGWSFFKVEADRGSAVTYETIRQWCLTFGRSYARTLRRRRGRMGGGISTSCSTSITRQIKVDWSAASGSTGYKLMRWISYYSDWGARFDFEIDLPPATLTYTDITTADTGDSRSCVVVHAVHDANNGRVDRRSPTTQHGTGGASFDHQQHRVTHPGLDRVDGQDRVSPRGRRGVDRLNQQQLRALELWVLTCRNDVADDSSETHVSRQSSTDQ